MGLSPTKNFLSKSLYIPVNPLEPVIDWKLIVGTLVDVNP